MLVGSKSTMLLIITSRRRETRLATLTATKPDCLTVLLQLGDELITLLDHVSVLLVLVIWPVGLDDALDTVNCARNPVCCNESGQIPTFN